MTLASLHRTLNQELVAILRRASLECPVCGEFVLRLTDGSIFCPECGCAVGERTATIQDAGRVTAGQPAQ